MTRLKDSTFEDGSLTGTLGGSSTVGSPTLDATGLMKGAYCVSFSAATQYVRYDFTASDDIYVTGYLYFTVTPAANTRMIYINNGVRLDLRTTGRLRLADAAGTAIGSDSAVLSTNTLYRFGVHWKKSTGANDGQAEAYVTAAGSPEAAFGAAFASSTTLTQAAQLARVDAGNTTSPVAAFSLDNIRIDNAAMPAADGTPDLTTDLVAYWKLDETSGSRADSAGSNTLADNNTVTSGTGKQGNAALFTLANSEYLSISDNTALSMGNRNVSFNVWVKMNSKPAGNASILAKWNYSGGTREYNIGYDGTADRFQFSVTSDGTNGTLGQAVANNFGSPSTGVWYNIHASYNAATDTLSIAVNDGTPNTASYSAGILDSTSQFNLGAMNNGGDLWWDGYIDEVGIWKRILTSTEITFLYNGGSGRTHPFAATTDTPKTITISVTSTLTFGPKAVGKPITKAITSTVSIARTIAFIKALIITLAATAIKAKPLLVALAVNSAATIQKTVGKPISVAVTNTIAKITAYGKIISNSVTSTVNITKAFPMLITKAITSTISTNKNILKTISRSVLASPIFTKGLVTLKTISYAVTSTIDFTKGIVNIKNITYAVTSTVTFAKGMVNLKTITLAVTTTVPRALKNVGKPITQTVTSTLTRLTNIPKNVLVSVTPILFLNRSIAVTKVKAITSTASAIVGKGYFRTVDATVNTSLFIQKNILKPILLAQTVIVSLGPKQIAKTIARQVTATVSSIYGALKLKTITYNATVSVNKNVSIGKTFTVVANTIVTMQRLLTLLIERIVIASTLPSVQRNIQFTKTILVDTFATFSKLLANAFTNTYLRKNVRELTLSMRNTIVTVLGKNSRTLDLKDTDES